MNKLLAIFFFFFSFNVCSQKIIKDSCYWFSFKAGTKINEKTKKQGYFIIEVAPKIEHGLIEDFILAFRKNIKIGLHTIGPFSKKENAKLAKEFYKQFKYLNEDEIYRLINKEQHITRFNKVFWYNTSFIFNYKNQKLIFRRTPAAIAPGNLTQFKEFLSESLQFQKLAIGPFSNMLRAEMSKYYQRLYGEKESGFGNKFRFKYRTKRMQKKRHLISLMTKYAIKEKDINKIHLFPTFSLPEYFFDRNTILIVHIEPEKEGNLLEHSYYTLQGEKIKDNNKVIPWKSGGDFPLNAVINRLGESDTISFLLKGYLMNKRKIFKINHKYSLPIKTPNEIKKIYDIDDEFKITAEKNIIEQLEQIAYNCHKNKQFEKAYKIASKLIKMDSTNYKHFLNLSWYSLFVRKPGNALNYAKKTLKIKPYNNDVIRSLALGYLMNNEYLSAKTIYLKYKNRRINYSNRPFRDIFLQDINDLENAGIKHEDFIKVKEKILNINSELKDKNNIEQLEQIAYNHSQKKQYKKAYDVLTKLIQLDSTNYKYFHSLSWYSLFIGKPNLAIKYAKKSIKMEPKNIGVYTNLALGYLLNEEFSSAESIYLKWKNKKINNNRTFRDVFLQDINDLENAGINHNDFVKVKLLLKEDSDN